MSQPLMKTLEWSRSRPTKSKRLVLLRKELCSPANVEGRNLVFPGDILNHLLVRCVWTSVSFSLWWLLRSCGLVVLMATSCNSCLVFLHQFVMSHSLSFMMHIYASFHLLIVKAHRVTVAIHLGTSGNYMTELYVTSSKPPS